jgi:NADPH:quinone reductase-like Zn-dependent oxidoreductase
MRLDLVGAALNRREWWLRNGHKIALPAVLGSDGAGIVSAVGPQVEGVCVGDEVVIYPGVGWATTKRRPLAAPQSTSGGRGRSHHLGR